MTATGVEAALNDLDRSRRVGWARAYEAQRRVEALEQELSEYTAAFLDAAFITRAVAHLLASDKIDTARWLLWLTDSGTACGRLNLGDDALIFACRMADYFEDTRPWFPSGAGGPRLRHPEAVP